MSPSETLAERLRGHVEQMANTSWGLTIEEWNVISNDILAASRALDAERAWRALAVAAVARAQH